MPVILVLRISTHIAYYDIEGSRGVNPETGSLLSGISRFSYPGSARLDALSTPRALPNAQFKFLKSTKTRELDEIKGVRVNIKSLDEEIR
jgi:hypothetical protein